MIPSYYTCTACRERFDFSSREAVYLTGVEPSPLPAQVRGGDLLHAAVRPGWCKACDKLTLVEDIASLRDFENAYGAVRAGRTIEYPIRTAPMNAEEARQAVEPYLRWRMNRRRAPRALCCGGDRFQLLDVATPLLKHEGCEFGFIEGLHDIGSHGDQGPGIGRKVDIPVYSTEGSLIGRLTWREYATDLWTLAPDEYPEPEAP